MSLKLIPLEERIVLDAAVAATVAAAVHAIDHATVVFVDQNAKGSIHDGQSWKTAYLDLQTALHNATGPETILMAAGTYTPGTTPDSTFNLPNSVQIIGGAKGGTTILSGDLGNGNHTNTIVTANGVNAELDNLTITGAVNSSNGEGGGISETNGSNLQLNNDIFKNNTTTLDVRFTGGGAIFSEASSLTISNSQFENNTSAHIGAAILAIHDSLISIDKSDISNNTANEIGGALSLWGTRDVSNGTYGTVNLTKDTFNHNSIGFGGGAISIADIDVFNLTQSSLSYNSTQTQGGAIFGEYDNIINISGNNFSYNIGASFGGALACVQVNALTVSNNIFKGNTATDTSQGGGYGGALDVEPLIGSILVKNNLFMNNRAAYGGALDTQGESGPVSLIGNIFIKNTASIQGGAYWDGFEGGTVPLTLTGNIFAGNMAPQGNSIWMDGSELSVNGQTSTSAILNQLVDDNNALFSNDIFLA